MPGNWYLTLLKLGFESQELHVNFKKIKTDDQKIASEI